MFSNYVVNREEWDGYVKELFDDILKDKLNVQIHEIYPLKDIARAHTVRVTQPPRALRCLTKF